MRLYASGLDEKPFERASVPRARCANSPLRSVWTKAEQFTLGQRVLRSPLGSASCGRARSGVFVAQMGRIFARAPSSSELDGMWSLLDPQVEDPDAVARDVGAFFRRIDG